MTVDEIKNGNENIAGVFAADIKGFQTAQKLNFEVSLQGTPYRNSWNIWVYPAACQIEPGNVHIT